MAHQAAKDTIKKAALMLLEDLGVMRKGELIAGLEAHMTATERGKHFFEVREAVAELVAAGRVKLVEFRHGEKGTTHKLVTLPQLVLAA
ncbi:hypothetical protein QU487_06435 [Crenobacter sp. SG2305]|uniref:hypothetical protein n=1 Tax=Crenobacter oryzisoli TaxID=3056844 RepID=UPI0025AB59FB|nr:hypothetical protein [Crenobacter sp. SG2305]MDN0082390.1 hypothetical protein [Crenobacter sp. SG2305]